MMSLVPPVFGASVDELINVEEVTVGDVLAAVLIMVAAFVIARLVRKFVLRWLPDVQGVPDYVSTILARIAFYFVLLIGAVYSLSLLGIDTGPIVLLLLLLVVVLFLSLRPLLENYAAGLVILTREPFAPGDQIIAAGYTGVVGEINGRSTVIETIDGQTIRVPNTDILGATMVNESERGARRTTVHVGLAYGTDLALARTTLVDAVEGITGVLTDPPPQALLTGFDDSSIGFDVLYWRSPYAIDDIAVRDRVVEAVDQALKAADIVVAFPQTDVWMRDASTDTES